jgi:uncharacterized protein (TIGR03066 family)
MRNVLAISVMACALLFAFGCAKSSNPMVGTWKMELSDEMQKKMPSGQKVDIVAEFKEDNTFAVKVDAMGRKDDVSGTYELKGKALTMHQKMEGGKPSNETQEATLADDMKSFTAPGMEAMGKMVKQ